MIFILSLLRIRRYGFITAEYLKFRRGLKQKGARLNASSTPSDVIREASRLGIAENASEFVRFYEMARFGGKELTAGEKEKYRSIIHSRRCRVARSRKKAGRR